MSILDRLAGILVNYFGIEPDEVLPEATFAELDLDSLAIVELALIIEKEFGVAIRDDEVTPKATVTEALQMLGAKGIPADD